MQKLTGYYLFFLYLFAASSIPSIAQQISLKKTHKTHFLNPQSECQGSGQLIYDDGSFENAYIWNNTVTNGRIVMLFTPAEYPWQFNTFCIALTQLGFTSTFNFTIEVYNVGTGGSLGNLIAVLPGNTAENVPYWPALAWYSFDISSVPKLTSGSYYIGIKWNPSLYLGFGIGADESAATPIQPGYASAYDGVWTTIQAVWSGYKAMGMRTLGGMTPCFIESASNPNPQNGESDVSINLPEISWVNGTGDITNETYFGKDPENLTLVQSGTLSSSYVFTEALDYSTTYYWKIIEIGDTCNTTSSIWHFKTEQNPFLNTIFFDDFENGTSNWTITNDGGTCVWQIFSDPSITSRYSLPVTASGGVFAADADHCGIGTTTITTATLLNQLDATNTNIILLDFDNDWLVDRSTDEAHVEVSTNGGSTWTGVWDKIGVSVRATHETIDLSPFVAGHNFKIRFRSVQPEWDWWWVIDNVTVSILLPIELTSFKASTVNGNVNLTWSTATETNNKGFQVERKSADGEYQNIAFVNGHGTTTQPQQYTYMDQNVAQGHYTYRLKQTDLDGSYKYSNAVEVDVTTPAVYSLDQNYPNPFNPTTKIDFSLANNSKVTLKVYDVLGRQIAELLNSNLTEGSHTVNFNASNLPSGIYFYRLEAKGTDGKDFTSIKKMILLR